MVVENLLVSHNLDEEKQIAERVRSNRSLGLSTTAIVTKQLRQVAQ